MSAVAVSDAAPVRAFRHEALFYAGEAEFVSSVSSFVRDAVRAREPVMVVVPGPKIEPLRASLDGHAANVRFEDMADAGRNPGRIISVWADFASEYRSANCIRGIGEPIWAERTADELAECERHEGLLNLAFGEAPIWLVCPYDTATLDQSVVDRATRTHHVTSEVWPDRRRTLHRLQPDIPDPFDGTLPDPPADAVELEFDKDHLGEVRGDLTDMAGQHGLSQDAIEGLLLALNEVATNSVRYGGGRGVFRTWRTSSALVCEVRDQGVIQDPLAGRFRPEPMADRGFGLWLANQLCDLVQIRSSRDGSTVRLHMRLV